jgi:hypothetical protein
MDRGRGDAAGAAVGPIWRAAERRANLEAGAVWDLGGLGCACPEQGRGL